MVILTSTSYPALTPGRFAVPLTLHVFWRGNACEDRHRFAVASPIAVAARLAVLDRHLQHVQTLTQLECLCALVHLDPVVLVLLYRVDDWTLRHQQAQESETRRNYMTIRHSTTTTNCSDYGSHRNTGSATLSRKSICSSGMHAFSRSIIAIGF